MMHRRRTRLALVVALFSAVVVLVSLPQPTHATTTRLLPSLLTQVEDPLKLLASVLPDLDTVPRETVKLPTCLAEMVVSSFPQVSQATTECVFEPPVGSEADMKPITIPMATLEQVAVDLDFELGPLRFGAENLKDVCAYAMVVKQSLQRLADIQATGKDLASCLPETVMKAAGLEPNDPNGVGGMPDVIPNTEQTQEPNAAGAAPAGAAPAEAAPAEAAPAEAAPAAAAATAPVAAPATAPVAAPATPAAEAARFRSVSHVTPVIPQRKPAAQPRFMSVRHKASKPTTHRASMSSIAMDYPALADIVMLETSAKLEKLGPHRHHLRRALHAHRRSHARAHRNTFSAFAEIGHSMKLDDDSTDDMRASFYLLYRFGTMLNSIVGAWDVCSKVHEFPLSVEFALPPFIQNGVTEDYKSACAVLASFSDLVPDVTDSNKALEAIGQPPATLEEASPDDAAKQDVVQELVERVFGVVSNAAKNIPVEAQDHCVLRKQDGTDVRIEAAQLQHVDIQSTLSLHMPLFTEQYPWIEIAIDDAFESCLFMSQLQKAIAGEENALAAEASGQATATEAAPTTGAENAPAPGSEENTSIDTAAASPAAASPAAASPAAATPESTPRFLETRNLQRMPSFAHKSMPSAPSVVNVRSALNSAITVAQQNRFADPLSGRRPEPPVGFVPELSLVEVDSTAATNGFTKYHFSRAAPPPAPHFTAPPAAGASRNAPPVPWANRRAAVPVLHMDLPAFAVRQGDLTRFQELPAYPAGSSPVGKLQQLQHRQTTAQASMPRPAHGVAARAAAAPSMRFASVHTATPGVPPAATPAAAPAAAPAADTQQPLDAEGLSALATQSAPESETGAAINDDSAAEVTESSAPKKEEKLFEDLLDTPLRMFIGIMEHMSEGVDLCKSILPKIQAESKADGASDDEDETHMELAYQLPPPPFSPVIELEAANVRSSCVLAMSMHQSSRQNIDESTEEENEKQQQNNAEQSSVSPQPEIQEEAPAPATATAPAVAPANTF
jgi:hypothetical protein